MQKYIPSIKMFLFLFFFVLALSICGYFFIGMESFRIVYGSVLMLLIPGYILSFQIFPGKELHYLQRTLVSFALSVTVVPLLLFILAVFGMQITVSSCLIVIGATIIIPILVDEIRSRMMHDRV